MKKVIAVSVFAILSLSSVAIAENVDMSSGGLEKVQKGVFKETWVNPNADLGKYSKVIIVPADFDFRDVKKGRQFSSVRRSNQQEFWISETNQERPAALKP